MESRRLISLRDSLPFLILSSRQSGDLCLEKRAQKSELSMECDESWGSEREEANVSRTISHYSRSLPTFALFS